jgi:hypothetical protein
MSEAVATGGATRSKAPVSFWIIAVVSLLWNAYGAWDYLATELQVESYLSQFSDAQREYFTNFPAWAVAFWAFGVWGALAGSIGLLLRKSWAVWMFALSLLGLLVTSIYNFVITDGADIMGGMGVVISIVIWIVALFLFFYSRKMAANGVLR